MKQFYLFSIIALLLVFCKGSNPEVAKPPPPVEEPPQLAETLAGAPKSQGLWGTMVSNIPNNISTTFTGNPETTRTVTWQSNLTTGEAIIGDNRYPSTTANSATSGYYHHRVDVTGLTAGTTYKFIVGTTAGATEYYSPLYNFTTKSASGSSVDFKVIHITDPQVGTSTLANDAAAWKRTLEAAVAKCPEAAFIVNTGDIVENAKDAVINYYFDYVQEKLAKYPFVYSMGNNDSTAWYNKYFNTPPNENNGLLYSFDYENVHFVNVDSNITLTGAQLTWLENDLKNTAKKWKVVMTHEADYGRNGSNTDKTKLFDKYNMDLVMAGHNHFYARTRPIDTSGNNKTNGTVWTIPNAAGTKFNEKSGEKYLVKDAQPNLPMFSIFRFTDTNIYLEAYTVSSSGAATLYDSYQWR